MEEKVFKSNKLSLELLEQEKEARFEIEQMQRYGGYGGYNGPPGYGGHPGYGGYMNR